MSDDILTSIDHALAEVAGVMETLPTSFDMWLDRNWYGSGNSHRCMDVSCEWCAISFEAVMHEMRSLPETHSVTLHPFECSPYMYVNRGLRRILPFHTNGIAAGLNMGAAIAARNMKEYPDLYPDGLYVTQGPIDHREADITVQDPAVMDHAYPEF